MDRSQTCSLVCARCVSLFPVRLLGFCPEFNICHQMRGRLSSLSTLCKRFASTLRRCDVDSFLNIGRLYQEIAPMEKRIDMHIDLLRREEFREMECVNDVVKCVLLSVPISTSTDPLLHRIHAQFDHISETYFSGFDFDLGERELGYALSFDHDLDMFAASLGLVKTSIEAAMKEDGEFGIAEVTSSRSDAGRSHTRRRFGYG
jgi:dynactin 1